MVYKIINHTIFKYLISGGTAAFVNLLLLHILDAYSGFHYLVSVNIAFITAFFVSFSLQKFWTFNHTESGKVGSQLIIYFLVSATNVFVNSGIVFFLMNYIYLPNITFIRPVVLAQFISAATVAIESFFIYKYLIFNNTKVKTEITNTIRILIVTQKIDKNDSYFGFFHDWVRHFSRVSENVTVISLETYEYNFPENVKVVSLGKENVKSRFRYLKLFYKYIYKYRDDYDVVFCHMSPIYVIVGYPFWKIFSKKICLWYVHRSIDFKLRLAALLSDKIFTATKESFRINSKKVLIMGQAVEVDHFTNPNQERKPDGYFNIITVGRITPIKRLEVLVEAVSMLVNNNIPAKLMIAGAPILVSDFEYESKLQKKIKELGVEEKITFLGPVPYKDLPKYYWNSDVCVNLAPTGGLDKTVLEAMMAGLPVITSNEAFKEHLDGFVKDLICKDSDSEDTAIKLANLYHSKNYSFIGFSLRKVVLKKSTLETLIKNIVDEMKI